MSQSDATVLVMLAYLSVGMLLSGWIADATIVAKGLSNRYPPDVMAALRRELALYAVGLWPMMVWELCDQPPIGNLRRAVKRALRSWGLWP